MITVFDGKTGGEKIKSESREIIWVGAGMIAAILLSTYVGSILFSKI